MGCPCGNCQNCKSQSSENQSLSLSGKAESVQGFVTAVVSSIKSKPITALPGSLIARPISELYFSASSAVPLYGESSDGSGKGSGASSSSCEGLADDSDQGNRCADDCMLFWKGGSPRSPNFDDPAIRDHRPRYDESALLVHSTGEEGKVKAKIEVIDDSCKNDDEGFAKITVIYNTKNRDGKCDTAAEREITQYIDPTNPGDAFEYVGEETKKACNFNSNPPDVKLEQQGGCSQIRWTWKCKIECHKGTPAMDAPAKNKCRNSGEIGIKYKAIGEVLWVKWSVNGKDCCSLKGSTCRIALAETSSKDAAPYYGPHYAVDFNDGKYKRAQDPSECSDELCKEREF